MSSTGFIDLNANYNNSEIFKLCVDQRLTAYNVDSVNLTNDNIKDLSEYTYDLSENIIYMIYQKI
jgi:hypothetical protein